MKIDIDSEKNEMIFAPEDKNEVPQLAVVTNYLLGHGYAFKQSGDGEPFKVTIPLNKISVANTDSVP
jgi:hypothetical protein